MITPHYWKADDGHVLEYVAPGKRLLLCFDGSKENAYYIRAWKGEPGGSDMGDIREGREHLAELIGWIEEEELDELRTVTVVRGEYAEAIWERINNPPEPTEAMKALFAEEKEGEHHE